MTMRTLAKAVFSLAFSTSICAQTTSPAVCETGEAALKELRTFGELILRLTRDQTKEAAEAKYQIGVKGLAKGWTSEGERNFIEKFLSSEQYLNLQREREPHRAAMVRAQALWRGGIASTPPQEVCESTRSARRAVEASYEISQREQELLARMLGSE